MERKKSYYYDTETKQLLHSEYIKMLFNLEAYKEKERFKHVCNVRPNSIGKWKVKGNKVYFDGEFMKELT